MGCCNKPECRKKLMNQTVCALSVPEPPEPPLCPLTNQKNYCSLSQLYGGDGRTCPLVKRQCPCQPFPPCPLSLEDEESTETISKTSKKKVRYPSTYSACEKKKQISSKGDFKQADLEKVNKPNYKVMKKGMNVPDCTLSSTRPLPCSECIGELLSNPEKSPGCKERIKDCPFIMIENMCDDKCLCDDVPKIDTGPPCPFAPKGCPCCATVKCPLTRIPECPIISKQTQGKSGKPQCFPPCLKRPPCCCKK